MNGCQIWPLGCSGNGYPMRWDSDAQKMISVHVEVCEAFHGPKPFPGAEAAHRCGTRRCINPEHLRWATHKENMEDTVLHGRSRHPNKSSPGEHNPGHKITAAEALEIFASVGPSDDVALCYGVSGRTVRQIRQRETWGHLHARS